MTCVTKLAIEDSMNLKTINQKINENPLSIQEGGDHYKGYPVQPVEFAMFNRLDLCQANVVKYVVRFRDKGGIDDLRKARHYLELLAMFEYGETLGE